MDDGLARLGLQSVSESDGFYKQLIDSLYDAVYFVDRERRITYWNKAAEKLTGFSAAEVVGRCCSDNILMHIDDAGCLLCINRCPLSFCMQDGQPREAEVRLRHKLGHRVPVAVRAAPIRDTAGSIVGAVEIFNDNSAKIKVQEHARSLQRALEQLNQSRSQLHAIVDNLPIGVWSTDSAGTIVYGNVAAQRIWGGAQLVGVAGYGVYKARWADTGKPVEPQEWGAYRTVTQGETTTAEVMEIETFDGKHKTISYSSVPVRDDSGRILGAIVINEDITERRLAEASLMKAEKLASAGRVAAAIAHEINNPVAAVMNLLYLLGRDASLGPKAQELVNLAEEELQRVAQISRLTLGFYRDQVTPSAVDLGQLLDEVVALYARKLEENSIRVETRYRVNSPIQANAGELRQLFSNLVSNAIDALPSGGRLALRVAPSHRRSAGNARGVRILVADNGQGINSHDLPRLFEAFFSTKGNVGTGLGLWVSRNIVQKHGGTIRARSSKGHGTVFNIFLPATARTPVRTTAAGSGK